MGATHSGRCTPGLGPPAPPHTDTATQRLHFHRPRLCLQWALGFFQKQGYTHNVAFEPARYLEAGVIEYDRTVLMECELHAEIPYARLPHFLRTARAARMREWAAGTITWPFGDYDCVRPGHFYTIGLIRVRWAPESSVGLRQPEWDPRAPADLYANLPGQAGAGEDARGVASARAEGEAAGPAAGPAQLVLGEALTSALSSLGRELIELAEGPDLGGGIGKRGVISKELRPNPALPDLTRLNPT